MLIGIPDDQLGKVSRLGGSSGQEPRTGSLADRCLRSHLAVFPIIGYLIDLGPGRSDGGLGSPSQLGDSEVPSGEAAREGVVIDQPCRRNSSTRDRSDHVRTLDTKLTCLTGEDLQSHPEPTATVGGHHRTGATKCAESSEAVRHCQAVCPPGQGFTSPHLRRYLGQCASRREALSGFSAPGTLRRLDEGPDAPAAGGAPARTGIPAARRRAPAG